MKRLITFVAIVTSMASPAAQSPPSTQVAALDLTAPDVVRTSGPISVEGRLVSGTPQPTGLEVRLLRMSRNDFRLGDRFVFEVEVKNAGKVPIDFPRSVDFASFVPGDANNRTARINLEVRAQNQPPIIFGVTRLAGSQAQPGSLQRLEPGETMLIRLPGGVSLDVTTGAVTFPARTLMAVASACVSRSRWNSAWKVLPGGPSKRTV